MSKYSILAKFGADTKQFTQAMKKAGGNTNMFGKQMMKLGGMLAGAFSVGAIVNFGKKAVELADVQAKAEAKLKTALDGNADAYTRLTKLASDLQGKTLFGDEKTIEAMSFLAAMEMSESEIKKMIPLIQDFATAQNMDLNQAAKLVAKSFGGSTNAMSRYGIEITGAAGSVDRLNQLQEGLNNQVGGQAKAAAESGSGAIGQLSNAMGDLYEVLGQKLTPAINAMAKESTSAAIALTELLKASESSSWQKLWAGFKMGMGDYSKIAILFAREAIELAKQNRLMDERVDERDKLSQLTLSGLKKELEYTKLMTVGLHFQDETYKGLVERMKTINQLIGEKIKLQARETAALQAQREANAFTGSTIQGKTSGAQVSNDIDPGQLTARFIPKLKEYRNAADEYVIATNDLINQSMSDMAGNVGVFMAEAVAAFMTGNANAGDMLKGLLSMFADFMQKLGQMMIKQAVMMLKFQTLLFTNPVAAIAAGVAVMAFGAAMKGAISNMMDAPQLAAGGLAYGPTAAIVGDNPRAHVDPEVIAPLSKLQGLMVGGDGNVVFTIAGDKLKGVLNKHNHRTSLTT
jgi:hypothetical protein